MSQQARTIQFDYQGKAGLYDVVVSAALLLIHLVAHHLSGRALSALSTAADASPHAGSTGPQLLALWGCAITLLVTAAAHAVVGSEQYKCWWRGPYSIGLRALHSLGLLSVSRHVKGRLFPVLWDHRIFCIHAACAVARIPSPSYWAGAAVSITAATLVDLAGPAYTECTSFSCMLQCLQDTVLSAGLRGILQQLLQLEVLRCLAIHVMDVVLPGLLLVYLEARAYRHWVVKQVQQHAVQYELQQVPAEPTEPGVGAPAASERAGQLKAVAEEQQVALLQPQQQPDRHQQRDQSRSLKQWKAQRDSCGQCCCSSHVATAGMLLPGTFVGCAAGGARDAEDGMKSTMVVVRTLMGPITPLRPLQSCLYVSPVQTQLHSFKFSHPYKTSPSDLEAFKQQLTVAMQSSPQSWPAAAAGVAAGLRPVLTQCSAFPGCYQLVFTAVTPHVEVIATDAAAAAAHAPAGEHQGSNGGILLAAADTDESAGIMGLDELLLRLPTGQLPVYPHQLLAAEMLQAWPAWGLLGLQQHVVAAGAALQAGVALDPVAAVLPAAVGDSHSYRAAQPAGHQSPVVLVAGYVAADLIEQGYSSIRAVVTKQPQGAIIWDQSWVLQAPAAAEPAAGGVQVASNCVRLPLSWQGLLQSAALGAADNEQQQRQVEVLSVVVLAEGQQLGSTNSSNSSLAGLAPATTGLHDRGVTAATAAGQNGAVVAQLPLLLLPAGPQQELQQLMADQLTAAAGVEAESDYVNAFQQMLPILQDWSTVTIMESQGNSSLQTGSGSSSGSAEQHSRQYVFSSLCNALASLFREHDMGQCLGLLQGQQQGQQQQLQQQPQLGVELLEAARHSTSQAGSVGDVMQDVPQSNTLGDDPLGRAATAVLGMYTANNPGNETADCAGDMASRSSSNSSGGSCSDGRVTVETSSNPGCSSSLHSSCTASADAAVVHDVPHTNNSCKTCSYSSRVRREVSTSAAPIASQAAGLGLVAEARLAVFGFGSPAVEQAYLRYRSANLCRWDLAVALWYSLGLLVTLGKVTVLYVQAAELDSWPTEGFHVGVLRALILAFSAAPHAVMWYACCRQGGVDQQQHSLLRSLGQQRGVMFVLIAAIIAGLFKCYLLLGGVFAMAVHESARQYYTIPILQILYVFVVQSMLYRAGAVAVVLYCCIYFVCIAGVVGRPLLFGLPGVEGVLYTAICLVLSVLLDVSMRRAFLRNSSHQRVVQ